MHTSSRSTDHNKWKINERLYILREKWYIWVNKANKVLKLGGYNITTLHVCMGMYSLTYDKIYRRNITGGKFYYSSLCVGMECVGRKWEKSCPLCDWSQKRWLTLPTQWTLKPCQQEGRKSLEVVLHLRGYIVSMYHRLRNRRVVTFLGGNIIQIYELFHRINAVLYKLIN